MNKLINISGISSRYAELLHRKGIDYQEQLLTKCRNRSLRKHLCEDTGISEELILKWTNHADLARIRFIGEEYANLLEQCGVDSVPELAHRCYENLFKSLKKLNDKDHLVEKMPSVSMVKCWIDEAKLLPKIVYH